MGLILALEGGWAQADRRPAAGLSIAGAKPCIFAFSAQAGQAVTDGDVPRTQEACRGTAAKVDAGVPFFSNGGAWSQVPEGGTETAACECTPRKCVGLKQRRSHQLPTTPSGPPIVITQWSAKCPWTMIVAIGYRSKPLGGGFDVRRHRSLPHKGPGGPAHRPPG